MKFLIINGPNLNLLGRREPGIYGKSSYADLCTLIEKYARDHGSTVRCFQSNHEGAIIDEIHAANGVYDAIVINPGAYTHYSYAILDALKAVDVPAYEVHISHIDQREPFRAVSVTAPACVGQIYGLGFDGYLRAMDYFLERQAPKPVPRLCVIGDPIAHSLSPRIQAAMLAALGAPGTYTAQRVTREELPAFLERVRAGEFTGFNATMPHKQDLADLVDELDDSARRAGSVNTVCLRDGRLVGFSTDGAGLTAALAERGIALPGRRVTLLGAGGAARSVVPARLEAGAARVTVSARNLTQAAALCDLDPQRLAPTNFTTDAIAREAAGSQLRSNCPSLGMTGQGEFDDLAFVDALPEGAAVCDLIYDPGETKLLRRARNRGLPAMNGLPMLVWQGVLALEQFLGGRPLDREKLARAAYQVLEQSKGCR